MRKFLVFLVILFQSNTGSAIELDMGIAPTYSRMTVKGLTKSSDYQGAGAASELRLKIGRGNTFPFGFDLFGIYTAQFPKNTNLSTAETAKILSYGGGVDITWTVLYVGGQAEEVKMYSNQPGQHSRYFHHLIGARGGFNFFLSRSLRMTLGGIALFGSTDVPIVTASSTTYDKRSVSEYRGFLMFSYCLFGNAR